MPRMSKYLGSYTFSSVDCESRKNLFKGSFEGIRKAKYFQEHKKNDMQHRERFHKYNQIANFQKEHIGIMII